MNSDALAAFVLATGLWLGLSAVAIGGGQTSAGSDLWTVTSSAKVASHPTLVRAARPMVVAGVGR